DIGRIVIGQREIGKSARRYDASIVDRGIDVILRAQKAAPVVTGTRDELDLVGEVKPVFQSNRIGVFEILLMRFEEDRGEQLLPFQVIVAAIEEGTLQNVASEIIANLEAAARAIVGIKRLE